MRTRRTDHTLEPVPGLESELLERVVRRLLELEPDTIAMLVSGSYAKGTADEWSDLDVQVVTRGEPMSPYRMWFEERPAGHPLHVSPSVKSLEGWLAKREEPQEWALGFPVLHVVRYVWATEEARLRLGDPPSNIHPHPPLELEDFVEFLQKTFCTAQRVDGVGVRHFAHEAALLAPRLPAATQRRGGRPRPPGGARVSALGARRARALPGRPARMPGTGSRGRRCGAGRGVSARTGASRQQHTSGAKCP